MSGYVDSSLEGNIYKESKQLYLERVTPLPADVILVPRGRAPFGQQESWHLARSNVIPVLNGFVNTIDWDQNQSDLSDLTLSMRRVTGSPWIADFRCWTWPEVAIFGADQKGRSLWGREWVFLCFIFYNAFSTMKQHLKSLKFAYSTWKCTSFAMSGTAINIWCSCEQTQHWISRNTPDPLHPGWSCSGEKSSVAVMINTNTIHCQENK